MHETAKELVRLLGVECDDMKAVQAVLKNLFKGTIEKILEAEIDEHLAMKSIQYFFCFICIVFTKLNV